jgi:transcription elongation factor GreA
MELRELANRPPRSAGHEPTASLTLEAYLRLKDELGQLKTEGRTHISERIKAAREHGDIRENAEYDAAKNEQGLMESRVRNLERMLRDPDIIETPPASDVVAPGMLITLRPLEDDDPEDESCPARGVGESVPRRSPMTASPPKAVIGADWTTVACEARLFPLVVALAAT